MNWVELDTFIYFFQHKSCTAANEMIRQQVNSRQYLIYVVCTITAWNLLPEDVAEARKYRWVHDGIRKRHKGEVHWWLLKLMIWIWPLAEEVLLIGGSWEDTP